MARSTTSPDAHSGKKSEHPWVQGLLDFDQAGAKNEVYDHMEFRALLRKHWANRSIAAVQRRNPAAGGSSAQSNPRGGDAIAAAKADMGEKGRS